MTVYRRCVYTHVILFLQISPTSKISHVFLRFAAGIADNHFHDKTTNHDSRRCGLPCNWVLSRAVGADARQHGGTAGGWVVI